MNRFKWQREDTLQTFIQRILRALMPVLWANLCASIGTMLAMIAAFLIFVMLCFHIYNALVDHPSNPYLDLIGFAVLPALLVAGVVLIVIGAAIRKARERRGTVAPVSADFDGRLFRRKVTFFIVATGLFLTVFWIFSYEAYHFTDSPEFCLKICHTVMKPEGVAYARSPHAHVACVSCHIGPGASWFVRSKISGLRQVLAVIGETYERPIPTPVHALRPARETCEHCHWPARFHGSRLIVKEQFENDRDNSPVTTALVLKVGGAGAAGGRATGVHWHIDPGNTVRYRSATPDRRQIVEVVQSTPAGEVRYLRPGAAAAPEPTDEAAGQADLWRTMDCIDCHNRPTHIFELPTPAVDAALARGELPRTMPFLRAEAVRALSTFEDRPGSAALFDSLLTAFYTDDHPEDLAALKAGLPAIAGTLAAIYDRNVFPEMRIGWGTYQSNISHFDIDGELAAVGCFRCHDDEMESEDGATISQDCDTCHNLLAWGEADWNGSLNVLTDFLVNDE